MATGPILNNIKNEKVEGKKELDDLTYEEIQKKIEKLKEKKKKEYKDKEKIIIEKIKKGVFEYERYGNDKYIYRKSFIKYLIKLKICSRKNGRCMKKIVMIAYWSNGGVGDDKYYQYLKYRDASDKERNLENKELDIIELTIEHQEPYFKQKAIEELCEIAPNCQEVLKHMREEKRPKRCPDCDTKIRRKAKFCVGCGGKVK